MKAYSTEKINIEVEYDELLGVTKTGKSYKLMICGEFMTIPISQVYDMDEEEKKFSIPEWLAEKKGLI